MSTVLNSWKQIAVYLSAGVRTVQRWEREAGLPVRRVKDSQRSPVLAFSEEIDAWVLSRKSKLRTSPNASPQRNSEPSRTEKLLREAKLLIEDNVRVRSDLLQTFTEFVAQRRALADSVRVHSQHRRTATL